jgi:ankyrin repeat protein
MPLQLIFFFLLDRSSNNSQGRRGLQIMKFLITQFSSASSYFLLPRYNYSPQHRVLKRLQTKPHPQTKRTGDIIIYVINGLTIIIIILIIIPSNNPQLHSNLIYVTTQSNNSLLEVTRPLRHCYYVRGWTKRVACFSNRNERQRFHYSTSADIISNSNPEGNSVFLCVAL